MADWTSPLPDTAVVGEATHVEDHNMITAALAELRGVVDGLEAAAPVFAWDGTHLTVDGVPGPDLQGPPGMPGPGVHQDLWNWIAPRTPGTGQVTVDDGVLKVHHTSAEKIDWSILIARVDVGDQIGVQDKSDATVWGRWDVTGPAVLNGEVFEVPVALADVPQGVDPTDGRKVVVGVMRKQTA